MGYGATHSTSTSTSLALSATGASHMYITNTSGCGSDGNWETYATSKAGWYLGQTNVTAAVYVKYRDEALNESSCVNDTIIHDNTNPSTPGGVNDGTAHSTTSVEISWSASTDTNSVASYEVAIGTSAGSDNTFSWTNVGNVTSYTANVSLTGGNTSRKCKSIGFSWKC